MNIIKAIFSTKSLVLGWAIAWRTAIAAVINALACFVIMYTINLITIALAPILQFVFIIYMVIFIFLATGWAVQRIKDKI